MAKYKVLIVSTESDEKDELLEFAWGIIANAYSGNWNQAKPQWRLAAEKWRDQWAAFSVKQNMHPPTLNGKE